MNDEVEGLPRIAELINATFTILKSAFIFSVALVFLRVGSLAGAEPASVPTAPATPEDTPCSIIEKIPPRFPNRVLKDGIAHGVVKMLLHVSSTGELIDTLVTAFTRKPFAEEALHAVKRWKFIPARSKGEPIDTIINMTFQF